MHEDTDSERGEVTVTRKRSGPSFPSWIARAIHCSIISVSSIISIGATSHAIGADFVRGDVDGSGSVALSDAISLLGALYTPGSSAPCWDAADVDDDGALTIGDPVSLLTYLFSGGPAPAAPFPLAGSDPTADSIGCGPVSSVVTLATPLVCVETDLAVTLANLGPDPTTFELHQTLAFDGGMTEATFPDGTTSMTLPPFSSLDTTIAAGAQPSLDDCSEVTIVSAGTAIGAFAIFRVRLESVGFNNNDDNDDDAVELRKDFDTDILVPEYVRNLRSHEVLYTAGQTPTVEATLTVHPSGLMTPFDLSAVTVGSGYPGLGPATVTGTGASLVIPVTFAAPTPLSVGAFDVQWRWIVTPSGGSSSPLATTSHRIFNVLGEPTHPWDPSATGGVKQPRVDALEILVGFAAGETAHHDTRTEIVTKGYDQPLFTYDTVSGGPGFVDPTFGPLTWNFDLDEFIAEGYGGDGSFVGACFDSAATIVTFSNLDGDTLSYLASGTVQFGDPSFGYINAADPIGTATPFANNPFPDWPDHRVDLICGQDGSKPSTDRSLFANHYFAGLGVGATAVVYDMTCRFDTDGNPDTTAVWPDGTAASTSITTTTLTDAGEAWTPDQFAGFVLRPNVDESGLGPYPEFDIVSNSSDTISVATGDLTLVASVGDFYEIFDPSSLGATMTRVTGYPWPSFKLLAIDAVPAANPDDPFVMPFELKEMP